MASLTCYSVKHETRRTAREKIAQGIDPIAEHQATRSSILAEQMRNITFRQAALEVIRKKPKPPIRIVQGVAALADWPDCMTTKDIKALKNHSHQYRMRVGRYRVLFDVETGLRVVSIEKAASALGIHVRQLMLES